MVSCDDDKKIAFFAIMKNVRDLHEIDEVQTTKLLELVYACIKNELGSSSQYPSWMRWPEFIWDRLKANRISRDWLADKLQVK